MYIFLKALTLLWEAIFFLAPAEQAVTNEPFPPSLSLITVLFEKEMQCIFLHENWILIFMILMNISLFLTNLEIMQEK